MNKQSNNNYRFECEAIGCKKTIFKATIIKQASNRFLASEMIFKHLMKDEHVDTVVLRFETKNNSNNKITMKK